MNVLPDAELVALTALRGNTDWQHLDVGAFTEIPADPTYPLITLVRIGGRPPIRGWLDRARIQVDAYALDKATARLVAATCQQALHAAEHTVTEHGLLGAVETLSGPRWLPDPTTRHPRYLLDLQIDTHPLKQGAST